MWVGEADEFNLYFLSSRWLWWRFQVGSWVEVWHSKRGLVKIWGSHKSIAKSNLNIRSKACLAEEVIFIHCLVSEQEFVRSGATKTSRQEEEQAWSLSHFSLLLEATKFSGYWLGAFLSLCQSGNIFFETGEFWGLFVVTKWHPPLLYQKFPSSQADLLLPIEKKSLGNLL